MIQYNNDLATQALKSIENEDFRPTRKRVTLLSGADSKRSAPLKRSRSTITGSFNMGEVLKVSEQVEETIAFPAIEWPSFDDDDSSSSDGENAYGVDSSVARREARDEDEDDEDFYTPSRKRQCRGLTRCKRSCNLTSLYELSKGSERRGSSGSLS